MGINEVSFPLLNPSISSDECLTQSLITLEEFNKQFNNLMDTIHNKIDNRAIKLNSIKQRIQKAKEKIQMAHKSTKVIRICSPGYFPKAGRGCRSDFNLTPQEATTPEFKYKLINESAAAGQTQPTSASVASFDLLHHGLFTPKFADGIGPPPDDLMSCANLLIYNTSVNPYKNYRPTDPLDLVPKSTKPENREQLPAEAPETVTLGHHFDSLQRLNFDYNPTLGDVPQIAVPDSLPELSGIVTDLKYSADKNETGIAPSIILTEITVDLPDLDSDSLMTSTAPPPPPPVEKPRDSFPADIRPPPPVQPVAEIWEEPSAVVLVENNPKPPENSMMKSLLDSIVKAGGTENFKLNKTKEIPKPIEPPREDPGDVMSQLKKVLKRRGDSLKGGVNPPEPRKVRTEEPPPLIKSISQIIKTDLSEEEANDNWSD